MVPRTVWCDAEPPKGKRVTIVEVQFVAALFVTSRSVIPADIQVRPLQCA